MQRFLNFTKDQVGYFVECILLTVHSHPVICRDLKPENILLDDNGEF